MATEFLWRNILEIVEVGRMFSSEKEFSTTAKPRCVPSRE
jgi:hypothetical protein